MNGQQKIGARLEISEQTQLDVTDIIGPSSGTEGMVRRNVPHKSRRGFNVDGMINLSNKGKRLAVMKLTDGESGNIFGRLQARFSDRV